MANPDQKTILYDQTFEEIKEICTKFKSDSGSSNKEVKYLLKEIIRLFEKELDQNKFGFK